MAYLGIDVERAHLLVEDLWRIGAELEAVERVLVDAAMTADLPVAAIGELGGLGSDHARAARAVAAAVQVVEAFRMDRHPLGGPFAWMDVGAGASSVTSSPDSRGYGSSSPMWDAAAGDPWDRVHQTASHNSYLEPGGVAALHEMGVRSFELDIHRGAPTDFAGGFVPWSPVLSFVAIAADAVAHDGGRAGDWLVYHDSLNPSSVYGTLDDGLEAIARLEPSDPLTLFVDNKDAFGGAHDGAALDAMLEDRFGTRLFGPAELLARAPGATTLREAIARAGWPTVDELDGRVMVVLTDEVASYDRTSGRAFVATPPRFEGRGASVVHVVEPDVVFHNQQAALLGSAELSALRVTNSVVRTYFGPRCTSPGEPSPNYRAVDVDVDEAPCPTAASPG